MHEFTINMTDRTHRKLWPPSRTLATFRRISELTDFLGHVSLAMPGKFCLACVGGRRHACVGSLRVAEPNRQVILGLMFHEYFEFQRLAARGGYLCSLMYNIAVTPTKFFVFTDASKCAIGGNCTRTGQYFR